MSNRSTAAQQRWDQFFDGPAQRNQDGNDEAMEVNGFESDGDGGGGGGRGGGGVDMDVPIPVVEPDKIEWKYARLPKDAEEEQREAEEDEAAGLNIPTYKCEICRVGKMIRKSNRQGAEVSVIWQRIQEEEEDSYRASKSDTHYETIAKMYNKTIYRHNKHLGTERKDLKQWTMAMVRYHFKKCDKSRLERTIDDDIDFLTDLIQHIRKNELVREKYVNGVLCETEVSQKSFDKVIKAMLTKGQLLKVRTSIAPYTGGGLMDSSAAGRKRKRDAAFTSTSGGGTSAQSSTIIRDIRF